jgi:hypothetical protein
VDEGAGGTPKESDRTHKLSFEHTYPGMHSRDGEQPLPSKLASMSPLHATTRRYIVAAIAADLAVRLCPFIVRISRRPPR